MVVTSVGDDHRDNSNYDRNANEDDNDDDDDDADNDDDDDDDDVWLNTFVLIDRSDWLIDFIWLTAWLNWQIDLTD